MNPRYSASQRYSLRENYFVGYTWYQSHPHRAALRRTLTGDLLHLLFGLGGLAPVDEA